MNKDFLKGIDKQVKKAFLAKLQSGQYILGPLYEPQKQLNFDLIPESGLYKCREDGQELTRDQVNNLKGYRMDIDVVSTRGQVEGNELPSAIVKIPLLQSEYLDSLLIDKSAKVLTFDETDGKFKTDTNSYSFDMLMKLKNDSSEPDFIMDEVTARVYVELLEKWC